MKVRKPWIAIIDHSINIGTKKLFVVLRIKADILYKRDKAISLEGCECIGLKVCDVVNGESVKNDLEEIFKIARNPTAEKRVRRMERASYWKNNENEED